jgi:carbon monoxide dehydrogenase subunit G
MEIDYGPHRTTTLSVSKAAGVNAAPVTAVAVKTGAVRHQVGWLKIMAPPVPITTRTSGVHTGAAENAAENVNVNVAARRKTTPIRW